MPKMVKGGYSKLFEIQFVAKYQKSEGGPFRNINNLFESFTGKKNQKRGHGLVSSGLANARSFWLKQGLERATAGFFLN